MHVRVYTSLCAIGVQEWCRRRAPCAPPVRDPPGYKLWGLKLASFRTPQLLQLVTQISSELLSLILHRPRRISKIRPPQGGRNHKPSLRAPWALIQSHTKPYALRALKGPWTL